MKFKTSFTCNVCGKEIASNNFRIEWGFLSRSSVLAKNSFNFIQVCHDDCSYGIHGTIDGNPIVFGDIIFSQLPFSPELTLDKLNELSQDNPVIKDKIKQIKNNIFD